MSRANDLAERTTKEIYDHAYWRLNKLSIGWDTWIEDGSYNLKYKDVRLLAVT